MSESNSGASVHNDNDAIDAILEQYDSYIIALANKSVPRNVVPPERLSDTIDELAQNVRIKLWGMAKKKSIQNLKAYIYRIVQNEVVNIVREYKSVSSLSINEEGELYRGSPLVELGEGMRDPLDEVEQEEVVADHLAVAVEIVERLPPRQQLAIICSLKDRIDDLLPLIEALRRHDLDIENMNWPKEKEDVQRLKASLSVIRKKLRPSFSTTSS